MESAGLNKVNPSDEITRHASVMRGIFECLPGRDVMAARLLDSSWEKVIAEMLQKKEQICLSPLTPIDLTDLGTLRFFLAQFPVGFPAFGFKLLQVANIKLSAGTPMAELTPFLDIHGQHVKFLTIGAATRNNAEIEENPLQEKVKLILNKCPGIETLCLQEGSNRIGDEDGEPVVDGNDAAGTELGPLPNLVGIDMRIGTGYRWTPHFMKFLRDLVHNAPKLAFMKSIKFVEQQPEVEAEDAQNEKIFSIFDFFNSVKHVGLVDFKMVLDFEIRGINSLLAGLRDFDLKIQKFDMEVFSDHPISDRDKRSITMALRKLVSLQEFRMWSRHTGDANNNIPIRLRLPPTFNIRKLNLNSFLDFPIKESQVPKLEQVEIPAWGFETHRENPFAAGSLFPKVKGFKLRLDGEAVSWKFGFPNLETLSMRLPAEALGTLGTFLSQFPTVVNLNLLFLSESSGKSRREAWWDVFTGGMRPMMTHATKEDVILGKIPPVAQNQNPMPHLLQGLPNLKRLKLEECPEVIACALVHLTATKKMERLEFLEIETTCPQIKYYWKTLKGYHGRVKTSYPQKKPSVRLNF